MATTAMVLSRLSQKLDRRISLQAATVLLALSLWQGLGLTATAGSGDLFHGLVSAQEKPKLSQDDIDKAVEKDLKALQGLWIKEKEERNGREPYWVPRYDGIYIENSRFQSTTKTGQIKGGSDNVSFTIDPTKEPKTIDFKWRVYKYIGIYKIEGDRLYFAVKEQEVRPGVFTSDLKAGAQRAILIITYKKEGGTAETKEKKEGPKLTQDEIDKAVEKDLKQLQGFWVKEKEERNGREPYWVPRYDGIYIEKSGFQSTTKTGQIPGGSENVSFTIDPTKEPKTIDFKWRVYKYSGIYKIEGNRLYFAVKEQEVRPGVFTSDLKAGAQRAILIITYKREGDPPPEKVVKESPKLTQDQIDKANAQDLKDLQGVWIMEKEERNGREPYWVPRYDGIYIEKSGFQSTSKNGDIKRGGDKVAFTLDATKEPKTIDFKWRNDKYIGIYKIEGNRLTFAIKEADLRPVVFSPDLRQGAQRAILVITYKRAK